MKSLVTTPKAYKYMYWLHFRGGNNNIQIGDIRKYFLLFYHKCQFYQLVLLVQFKYSSEKHSKQVKKSSRRLSTFKFYLSLLALCLLFSFLLLFNCVYHVSWLSHYLLELKGRMNQRITSFILCYVNGLTSIVSLNVSCMLGHHI